MKEDKDIAHFESVRDQMVMPRESFRLPIKAISQGVLERRFGDHNYEGLTKLTKRKEDVLLTDATGDTDTNSDNDTINDNDNDISNGRIDHGLQSTYGDRNGLQINYGDDDHKIDISDRIISANKKPIYTSYKDACSNNIITHGSNTLTHEGNTINHGNTPPVSSEQ